MAENNVKDNKRQSKGAEVAEVPFGATSLLQSEGCSSRPEVHRPQSSRAPATPPLAFREPSWRAPSEARSEKAEEKPDAQPAEEKLDSELARETPAELQARGDREFDQLNSMQI